MARHWATASTKMCELVTMDGTQEHYYLTPQLHDGAVCRCRAYTWRGGFVGGQAVPTVSPVEPIVAVSKCARCDTKAVGSYSLFCLLGGNHKWEPPLPAEQAKDNAEQIAQLQRGNRAPVKTDYSQLSHVALRLMAETQHEGNERYGRGNWQKGLPVSQLLSHGLEHILKFMNGDRSENHLGHALWNLEKAAHFMETRPDLIDIPGGGLNGK